MKSFINFKMLTSTVTIFAVFAASLVQAAVLPKQTGCTPGEKRTANGRYSVNCEYAATNITDAISWKTQPSFDSCLTLCDNNEECKAITFFASPSADGSGSCWQFNRFNNDTNFMNSGVVLRASGAVAK